jgi:MoaA/NifB/PqqE/SkfB family radical SAM enzyme
MNQFLNLNRIEFVVTNACTSHCKHCSLGTTLDEKKMVIDIDKAVEISKLSDINSIMTFGGEPLLYADVTCAIHKTATQNRIPSRQIITNGYFSNDSNKIEQVVKALKNSGINSLLLSVDAFHKEQLPLNVVYKFARAVCEQKIEGFKLHPAWVVNREHNNPYNVETEKCLAYFDALKIPVSHGNNIFPSGNAAIYLSEYYKKQPINLNVRCGSAKYTSRLDDVNCISINPNGDVMVCCIVIGNVYKNSIIDIISQYNPYENPYSAALLQNGVEGLVELAKKEHIQVDLSQHYSACSICREIIKKCNTSNTLHI